MEESAADDRPESCGDDGDGGLSEALSDPADADESSYGKDGTTDDQPVIVSDWDV